MHEISAAISAKDRKAILEWFPDIQKIKDPDLRAKVIRVLVRTWKEGRFKDLADVPCATDASENNVSHTNAVARAAVAIGGVLQDQYGIPINFDILLASAFLHDADKTVVWEKKGDTYQNTELGSKVGHSVYTACVAFEEGLPPDVLNCILGHTDFTKINPATVEAMIIRQADWTMVLCYSIAKGTPLHVRHQKK